MRNSVKGNLCCSLRAHCEVGLNLLLREIILQQLITQIFHRAGPGIVDGSIGDYKCVAGSPGRSAKQCFCNLVVIIHLHKALSRILCSIFNGSADCPEYRSRISLASLIKETVNSIDLILMVFIHSTLSTTSLSFNCCKRRIQFKDDAIILSLNILESGD